jgi:hypothetical protein
MTQISYRRHRFPPAVIQRGVWLYLRFTLSYRDVEDLLVERGIDVSYETVRRWVLKFGPVIARRLRQGRPRPSLMTGGMLERRPRLKLGFSHGGGAFGLVLPRLQHGWTVLSALRAQIIARQSG